MSRRNNKPHRQRLILLAEHLQRCRPQDYIFAMEHYRQNGDKAPYIITEAGLSFISFPFITIELPNVFPYDWGNLPELGLVVNEANLNVALEEVTQDFFEFTRQEYHHCFVPYMQFRDKFGGKRLNYYSSPKDVSFNIFSLLNNKFPKSIIRMVLVEKTPVEFSSSSNAL